MTHQAASLYMDATTPKVQETTQALSQSLVQTAVSQARRRVAPLWPLRHFVAVNPFLGLVEYPFETAVQLLHQRAGARMTAPRSFYRTAIENGRIADADLAAALAERPLSAHAPQTVADLKAFARVAPTGETAVQVPTVADVAQTLTHTEWEPMIVDAISRWAATYFDQGQAYWKSPWRDLPAYIAWRAEAAHDQTPRAMGIPTFSQTVNRLPETAVETIHAALNQLAIPAAGLEAYLHRLLMDMGGWAGFARYQLWEAELRGGDDDAVEQLLAIRLVWEVALLKAFDNRGLGLAWQDALAGHKRPFDPQTQARLDGELLLQTAFEKSYQRQLIAKLANQQPATQTARPAAQAAFCIDVRSEVFRRALEAAYSDVETIGFAGFFGFPIEYVRIGETQGGAQCPALLTPQFVIKEGVEGATAESEATVWDQRTMRQRVAKIWRSFKFGAVSCFGFVGPVGLAYIKNLVMDSLGKGRPVPHPAAYGLSNEVVIRLAPKLEPETMPNGRSTGMTLEQQIDVAEGVLNAMSLTGNFARLVLLVGHGSSTVNNPYATGLDCGACGGHTGEANVRVAVQVLNNPAVRQQLAVRGIEIPADTLFVAGLHDTTTDEITLYDRGHIPASHGLDLHKIEEGLAQAGRLARAERARLLNLPPNVEVDTAVLARSRDWSQVRPEWGLAGCAAFIVAPRQRTAGVDLNGRSFLHNYTWQQDKGFKVLELIMTAPMVVASWINLQYYGSTVDNERFGSGNKVLHNVVGTLGVLEGNGGDLRTGLPWQSVHDGEKYIHEPLRLSVMIEAPIDAMNEIIARHEAVRQLVDNGWLYLFALDEAGQVAHQYAGNLRWERLS